MSNHDQPLAIIIRTTIGVAHNEPTEAQLLAIKRDLRAIQANGHSLGAEDLKRVVEKYCKKGPILCLESVDNSDLNTILKLALQATPRS